MVTRQTCCDLLCGYVAVTIADDEPAATAIVDAQQDSELVRTGHPDEISGLRVRFPRCALNGRRPSVRPPGRRSLVLAGVVRAVLAPLRAAPAPPHLSPSASRTGLFL